MTHQPMKGIRILEVAQFTFTPAAGAILADWGAEVIKVEHAVAGDAQRGIKLGTGGAAAGSFQPLMEHPNRGKRSIGLALDNPEAREVLYELAATCDVFLTNYLPAQRTKLKIDVEDIRRANPNIIYVRGSAHGPIGPEADRGGFDASSFWSRGGGVMGCTPSDSPNAIGMPAGAFGDSMGGMTLAGGIAGALFARERTGETSVVDVSLLSLAMWATGLSVGNSLLTGVAPVKGPMDSPPFLPVNPLVGNFRTADGRYINFNMLQPGRYWAEVCRHLGLDDLIADPRFDTAEKLMQHAGEAGALVAEAIARQPYAYWLDHLTTMTGAWAPNHTALELANDPQVRANHYVLPVTDAEGVVRELSASPVMFDETPFAITRGPQFAEHTDEIVLGLGRTEEQLIDLKIAGAIT